MREWEGRDEGGGGGGGREGRGSGGVKHWNCFN